MRVGWPVISFSVTRIYTYVGLIFLFFVADSIMSYTAPLWIEEHLGNPQTMGLIIAFSSIVGLVCDIFLPRWCRTTAYGFFTIGMYALALLYPLTFLILPAHWLSFVWAMLIWGIYFELMRFSQFQFVHHNMPPSEHARGWGMLETSRAAAITVGPLLAILMIRQQNSPFFLAAAVFLIGLLTATTLITKPSSTTHPRPPMAANLLTELRIWYALIKRIWPVYLFFLSLVLFDAIFWTIGALLAESLRHQHSWGIFLFPAYQLPALITPVIAVKLARQFSKKSVAFLISIPAAVMIIATYWFIPSVPGIIIGTLLFASGLSVANTEIYAVFEDYVARLHRNSNDMIALQGSASSLGYIIGPILAGSLAAAVGYQAALGYGGILLLLTAMIGLWHMRHKTRLPQTELLHLSPLTTLGYNQAP